MSTTSPILLPSRSTMTRPSQPRAVSMLGVGMLVSFLVGYFSRALPAHAPHATDAWSQAPCRREPRRAPLPPAPLAGRDREVPALAQASGPPGLLVERLGGGYSTRSPVTRRRWSSARSSRPSALTWA